MPRHTGNPASPKGGRVEEEEGAKEIVRCCAPLFWRGLGWGGGWWVLSGSESDNAQPFLCMFRLAGGAFQILISPFPIGPFPPQANADKDEEYPNTRDSVEADRGEGITLSEAEAQSRGQCSRVQGRPGFEYLTINI